MATFKIKQGDRRPYLEAQLVTRDEAGEVEGPQDLTGATVVFTMKNKTDGSILIDEAPVTVVDSTEGMVQYEWEPGDTDLPGKYIGEFEATFTDEPITFPNGKAGFDILITAELS